MDTTNETTHAKAVSSTDLLGILEDVSYNLWMSAVCAASSPNGRRLFERMSNPQIGDTVMEITSHHIIPADKRLGFGKLVGVQDGDCITKQWTIETPSGELCNWTNAKIIAIPGKEFDWYPRSEPNAEVSGGAKLETETKDGEPKPFAEPSC